MQDERSEQSSLLGWTEVATLKRRATPEQPLERATPTEFHIATLKRRATPPAIGIVLALACLTRYEAWPIVFTALGLAAAVRWRQGETLRTADFVAFVRRSRQQPP